MRRLLFTTIAAVVAASITLAGQQSGRALGAARSSTRATTPFGAPPGTVAPRLLPGTRPNIFSIIQGNALNATNGVLPNVPVRLRDARLGRIMDEQLTDRSGLFEFQNIDPGTYIVEVLGADSTVLAASQLLNVEAGEAVSALVKLPFRIPPVAGLIGHSASQAAAVSSAAAASGVLAAKASACVSPPCAP